MMESIHKLFPIRDSRKSFYGKAMARIEDGRKELTSYKTIVCQTLGPTSAYIYPLEEYSQTTMRHIKEFLWQEGFKAETKKQMLQDYCSN